MTAKAHSSRVSSGSATDHSDSQPAGTEDALSNYLEPAFRLAFFIHSDKDIAAQIVTEAIDNLHLARVSQQRRQYYTPAGFSSGRPKPQTPRTKVIVDDAHLLQRLVYSASEPYEVRQEQLHNRATLTEEDLVIRFVKHLIKISIRRNSFYVAVGMSRLLHGYTTAETMEIYGALVQDPARIKDDSYFRACKRELMNELEQRFGPFLRRARAFRGEERFERDDRPSRHSALLRECLRLFTPWGTLCVSAKRLDGRLDELSHLAFAGAEPDKEHPIEVNRMHTIIHPDCYAGLAAALGLAEPESCLSLPRFQTTDRHSNGSGPRVDRQSPRLTDEALADIVGELERRAARRGKIRPRHLYIKVDGVERYRLDLDLRKQVSFEIEQGAEIIEVTARDGEGELKLASHSVGCAGLSPEPPVGHPVPPQNEGPRITFRVSDRNDDYRAVAYPTVVEVRYEETGIVKAVSSFLQRVKQQSDRLFEIPESNEIRRRLVMTGGITLPPNQTLFALAGSSSGSFAEVIRNVRHSELYQRLVFDLVKGKQSEQLLSTGGKALVEAAEYGYGRRWMSEVEQVSQLLLTMPDPYHSIGTYYHALYIKRSGNFEEARLLFESVAAAGPAQCRARAMSAAAAVAFDSGDFQGSLSMFLDASRAATSRALWDPQIAVPALRMVGVVNSTDGNHRAALAHLNRMFPLVRSIASGRPYLLYHHLNSLAVELMAVGRLEEAANSIRMVLASPYAAGYHEWQETGRDIALKTRRPSRSVIAVGRFIDHSEADVKLPLQE